MSDYWSANLGRRISRRRALIASATASLGAAFLAACGGSSSDSGSGDKPASAPVDKSGLLSKYEDTTSKAVPGGVWTMASTPISSTLDANANSAVAAFAYITPVYSTLTKYGRGFGRIPGPDTISGDAAESWEIAPGGQQITLKLRQNHKFDARPPTNGRAMTSADVKFSWDRSIALSPIIGDIYNAKSPSGPIESMSTPDPSTVVFKLAFPYGAITELFAYYYLHVMPKEADGGFNTKVEARGSGPFTITKYDPTGSGTVEMRKNPDWYVKGRPFLDGMIRYELSEYAASLAQFESKTVWSLVGNGVKQTEVLRVKRDHPEMVLQQNITTPSGSPAQNSDFIFSQREDSPFKDVRLRRAAAMLYDHEAYIDAFYNASDFRSVGLPFESLWNSHLAVQCFNWIDPRKKEFGDGSSYFQFNPSEAKKLISASGFTGSIPFQWRALVSNNFGPNGETLSNMLDGAFKIERKALNETDWRNNKTSGPDAYSGMFQGTAHGFNDDSFITSKYTPNGVDRVSTKPIPGISDMVTKIQSELDIKKRNELISKIQKDLAPLMLDLPQDTQQRQFSLNWPWLRNYGGFATPGFSLETSSGRVYTEYWYDATLKK